RNVSRARWGARRFASPGGRVAIHYQTIRRDPEGFMLSTLAVEGTREWMRDLLERADAAASEQLRLPPVTAAVPGKDPIEVAGSHSAPHESTVVASVEPSPAARSSARVENPREQDSAPPFQGRLEPQRRERPPLVPERLLGEIR